MGIAAGQRHEHQYRFGLQTIAGTRCPLRSGQTGQNGAKRLNFRSYIYATIDGCSDRAATVGIMNAIADRLTVIAARNPALGWQVIPLVEEGDFDDFDVDAQLLATVSKGRLPAINVNLSFDIDRGADGDPEVDALLASYGLVLLARIPADEQGCTSSTD